MKLFNNKISASVEISVCCSFRVFCFHQNSFLLVISTFFLFSLYCRNYCFFHLVQCDTLLQLSKRRSPSPMACYCCDWINLKAGILELAVKFAVSIPNLKRSPFPQSVSVILVGLIKKSFFLQALAHLFFKLSLCLLLTDAQVIMNSSFI